MPQAQGRLHISRVSAEAHIQAPQRKGARSTPRYVRNVPSLSSRLCNDHSSLTSLTGSLVTAQVEDLLRDAASGKVPVDALHALDDDDGDVEAGVEQVDLNLDYAQFPATEDVFLQGLDYVHATSGSVPQDFPPDFGQPFSSEQSTGIDPGLGAMIGLGGLSEALPPFEVMEELQVSSAS